ncbi:hypothetical protein SISSUDRAFT_537296 [Sistotremastrum suecicum HHB10207 ss-3]|uniref:WW domain-containing protein n=1 Tax=Sistotremastrum suecicum HHB10207 ss-3 TaxID=1314776 RepID=A0A165XRC2_9AGAM|nr:hypothetical protein SISSUDRAFT_537296 [Sistotremastrum suecicum HHB10207 ss-3]
MTLPPPTSLTFTRQLRPGQIRGTLPDAEWSTFLHPGGWSYYYHATDRVITDIDITDPSKYWPLQQRFDSRFYHDQVAWTRTQPHLAAEWELWIGDKGARWVDHATFSASELDQPASRFGELASANTLHMEERYWEFLQAHPCHRQAPVGASMHVEDVLTWSCTDQTLFNTSSSSFTKEQSQELLSTLRSLPDPELRPDERTKSYARAVRTWLVSAISRQIARDRIEMHYGRPSARAFREKERQNELTHLSDLALHGSSYTIFFIFSSILLFGTPTSYLRRIMDVDRRRFDSGVNQTRWRLFLQGLLKDWTDSNLLATVLIAYPRHRQYLPNPHPRLCPPSYRIRLNRPIPDPRTSTPSNIQCSHRSNTSKTLTPPSYSP